MAEENINKEIPTYDARPMNLQDAQYTPPVAEPEKKKAGIFTLLIGILLIVRGGMRINQEGMEIFGVIMVVVGLASLFVFVKDRI